MILELLVVAAITSGGRTSTPRVSTPRVQTAPRNSTPKPTTTKASAPKGTSSRTTSPRPLSERRQFTNQHGQHVVYRDNGMNWFHTWLLFGWLTHDESKDKCYDKDHKQISCEAKK
jgi:hypothetical protein